MSEIEYRKLTWPQVQEAAANDAVVIIPTAALEEHGPHLPVDTDILLGETIALRAARKADHQVLVMPPMWIGYEAHHMDFPGTIDVDWDLFVRYAVCVTTSLVRHGFRRLVILNSHGSNRPLIEIVARDTVVRHPETMCVALSWWELQDAQRAFAEVRESDVTSHACELETSAYLAIDEQRVRMDLAPRDLDDGMSPHFWSDLMGRRPDSRFKNSVKYMEIWSAFSNTGVRGDPTKATREKGEIVLDAAVEELLELLSEVKSRPIRSGRDHHGTKSTQELVSGEP
jgi:creatinine amidohydrolase